MQLTWTSLSLALAATGLVFISPVNAQKGVCAQHSQICHYDNGKWDPCWNNRKCTRDGAGCELKFMLKRDVAEERDLPGGRYRVVCS
ncbi:hypothetical protein V8F06_007145 [Rhypophila decipiens]